MKLSSIAEALAYKGKPGWESEAHTPIGMMGDRIQDDGQPQNQDIQALSQRAEERVATGVRAVLDRMRAERDTNRAVASECEHFLTVVWHIPGRLQELRRRIGLTRDKAKLTQLYHNVIFLAKEGLNVADDLPGDLQELFGQVTVPLEDLAKAVEAVLRGTGMWDMSAQYMGHTLKTSQRTRPSILKARSPE